MEMLKMGCGWVLFMLVALPLIFGSLRAVISPKRSAAEEAKKRQKASELGQTPLHPYGPPPPEAERDADYYLSVRLKAAIFLLSGLVAAAFSLWLINS